LKTISIENKDPNIIYQTYTEASRSCTRE